MRKLLFFAFIISACEGNKPTNLIANIDTNKVEISNKKEQSPNINFPLDSLLKFDSEDALKRVFGKYVKRSIGYYPGCMGEYPITLLYSGTKNEVQFEWVDTVNFSGLSIIKINGELSDWKTKEGITIGTTLKELEKLNKKPFRFSGFGWDYGGMVNWEGGYLDKRKVFVCLDYSTKSPESNELDGDKIDVSSDSDVAQKNNPIVREIRMIK
jgi:hypothetical protein